MLWILLALLAYALLAAVALGDRKMLSGPMPDPRVYAFYVGALGLLALAVTPFLGFPVPSPGVMAVALFSGALFILAAFVLYFGLHYFEASRIIPASGVLTPIFTLGLTYLIFPGVALSLRDGISFLLFILGIAFLTHQRSQAKLARNLVVAVAAAWLFGSSFALAKYVYDADTFWSGFLWMRIGGGLPALALFLGFADVRREVLRRKKQDRRSIGVAIFFLVNQALGASAVVVQSAAIALAPAAKVAFVNALQGFEYAILFVVDLLHDAHKRTRRFDWHTLFLRTAGIITLAAGLVIFALR